MTVIWTFYLRREGIFLSSEIIEIIRNFFESEINYKNLEVKKLVDIGDTYFTIVCPRTEGKWYNHLGRQLSRKATPAI